MAIITYFFVICSAILAPAQVTNENPLTVQGRLRPEAVPAGAITEITLDLDLASGHHAYLEQFQFKILEPANFGQLSQFNIQPVVKFNDVISKKMKDGVEGKARLTSALEVKEDVAPGDYAIKLELRYQACTKDYCLFPKKIPLTFALKVLPAQSNLGSDNTRPTFLLDSPLADAIQMGWMYAFLLAFLGGVLTSLTPCIFPMIPITLTILGNNNARRSKLQSFLTSLIYVLGIATTYSLLGVLAASTGALFGAFLGHPVVVSIISLIFVLMALSLFGLFEIQAPAFIRNRIGASEVAKGPLGTFVMGLLAGVIASPCVGPVLVSILTFVAQSQDKLMGFLLLFVFALGMGQLFILLGTFSSLSRRLPRSGAWMNTIKYILGLVMLGLAAYYIYPVIMKKSPIPTAEQQAHSPYAPKWQAFSDTNLHAAIANKQPIIIDFYADWCVACKELEKFTFETQKVNAATKNFAWLRFDATRESDEFNALKAKYKIVGLPTIVFYDDQGRWRQDVTLTGFEEPEEFIPRIEKLKTRK